MFEVSRGCKIAYLGSQSGLASHVKQRFPLFSRESEVSLTRLNFKSTHLYVRSRSKNIVTIGRRAQYY